MQTPNRRATRHAATRAELVAAAWDLVRERGLAGLAMRELADRVGMRAPSLYSYFASKHEIYDAMFGQAATAFETAMQEEVAALTVAGRADDALLAGRAIAHRYFDFCVSDVVRYELLFQRTIPGFEPSATSYAPAVRVVEQLRAWLVSFGVDDPAAADLWTAVLTGLTAQQVANEPGGARWAGLVDRAVAMVLRELAPAAPKPPRSRRTKAG